MKADKVLINGKVYSIKLDGERIRGEAVAISDGIISAVGSEADILKMIGEETEIIDCGGNTIMPGLADSHSHPTFAADMYVACNLFGARMSDPDLDRDGAVTWYQEKLKDYIDGHPEMEIIRGIGWDHVFFLKDERKPTRQELDAVCRNRPAILTSYDQHYIWVNTKTLELAGLDENTPSPESGVVYREADGFPGGIFEDASAIALVKDRIGDYSIDEYKEAILKFQEQDAVNYGVTFVQDAWMHENAKQAFSELAEEGSLKMRVRGAHLIDADSLEDDLKAMIDNRGKYDVGEDFKINVVKFFLESGYAFLDGDKVDESMGKLNFAVDTLANAMKASMEAGYGTHCHAMGDASVKLGVDAIAKARKMAGHNVGRETMAHFTWIPEGYIAKMGEMKLICSAQPLWAVLDSSVEATTMAVVGEEKTLNQAPVGRLERAGCIITYGTDFPISPPPNPWYNMHCAMTRRAFKLYPDYETYKNIVCGPKEDPTVDCVTMDDFVKGATINSAYQMFMDEITGSIEPGKSADLIILKCDIENMDPEDIYSVKVSKTIFKGETVYEAQ